MSEPAFEELVRRHVDFVYSAALRMVGDAQLAQDVTQGVFLALAKSARQVGDRSVLSGWLHRTARNIAANAIRSEVRRRAREKEAAAMNELLTSQSDASWEQLAPCLDDALDELSEGDKDALLLRFFEKKSAAEMAGILGISDEAAQKRVSRAVDRLREVFSKRGVAIGAGGLVVVITTNGVQAAPAGLALAVSTAALAGTALSTSTVIATTTKALAMTTIQKTLIGGTIALLAGAGVYEAHQNSQLQNHVQALEQQMQPLTAEIQQSQQDSNRMEAQLEALQSENNKLKSNQATAELLKLRGEATRLQEQNRQLAQQKTASGAADDPAMQHFLELKAQAQKIAGYFQQMPDKAIPEMRFLRDEDWLTATREANFDTDADIRRTLKKVRDLAKNRLPMGHALGAFARANNGQMPTDISQLKPFLKSALTGLPTADHAPLDDATLDSTTDAILQRYKLLRAGGNSTELPENTYYVGETAPVDKDYDSRVRFGIDMDTITSTGLNESISPDGGSY